MNIISKSWQISNESSVSDFPGSRRRALTTFSNLSRIRLAPFFTPIEKASRLRNLFHGAPEIYVKRDDLTGYISGGNKLRKLEYVMADVIAKGATTVISTGAVRSNHVRTTAQVARRLDLKCELVLSGEDLQSARANARITEILGVKVHIVATKEERVPKMEEVARGLALKGEVVYQIPLGASDEIGSYGLVSAIEEVAIQQSELGIRFDAIILPTSSCGTQAGLEVGKRLFDFDNLRILGVSAGGSADGARAAVVALSNEMLGQLGLAPASPDEINVDDNFVGPGYGIPSEQSLAAATLFATQEGLLLDPVYTAKAAAALIQYCRDLKFGESEKILFWHTGGIASLF